MELNKIIDLFHYLTLDFNTKLEDICFVKINNYGKTYGSAGSGLAFFKDFNTKGTHLDDSEFTDEEKKEFIYLLIDTRNQQYSSYSIYLLQTEVNGVNYYIEINEKGVDYI